jgi:hypothetical protein
VPHWMFRRRPMFTNDFRGGRISQVTDPMIQLPLHRRGRSMQSRRRVVGQFKVTKRWLIADVVLIDLTTITRG